MAQGLKQLNREALYWLEKVDQDDFEAEIEAIRNEKRSARKKADAKATAKALKRANRSQE